MDDLYNLPQYYDIAFSYRDVSREVTVLEECMRRFSCTPVSRVLEVCCGHAPHLAELLQRGYSYIGIDHSKSMLTYAEAAARLHFDRAEFTCANLVDFKITTPAHFAFVALASLYVRSTAELLRHFGAMAEALYPGALYFMEWCVDFDPMVDVVDSWEIERGGIAVKASYWSCSVNRIEQLYEDTLHLCVNDHGTELELCNKAMRRRIFPQEFLALVRDHTGFEFVGWWNDWDLNRPLDGQHGVDRPIIVLRRRRD